MSENGRRQRPGIALLIPLALLASSAVVYQASNAAFSDTTSNGANNWAAGSVEISDDDANSALVSVSGLVPSDTASKCLNVSYTGSLASAVRLYATGYSDSGLGQYLTITVEEGTGASGGATLSCSGFTGGTSLYTGTLDGFATTRASYATGVSTWAPTGASTEVKSYRLTWTVQDDNNANGTSTQVSLTWEARNT